MSRTELAAEVSRASNRVLIGFKEANGSAGFDEYGRTLVSPQRVAAAKGALRARGVEITMEFGSDPLVAATIPVSLLSEIQDHALVEYVEPDLALIGYDSEDTTWNVSRVNAPTAWSEYNDGAGVKLFILDSGIDTTHADLDPTVAHSCVTGESGHDDFGHGTAVAGIAAAAANDTMILGVAPGVDLRTVKVGSAPPNDTTNSSAMVCGFYYARVNGADVINLSVHMTYASTAVSDQINAAFYVNDIVVITAGGNNKLTDNVMPFPYYLPSVLSVAGADSTGTQLPTSTDGAEMMAPGGTVYNSVGLTTTCKGGSICNEWYHIPVARRVQGSSFAAPHVAAAAAILRADEPTHSAADIRYLLKAGALLNDGILDIEMSASLPLPYPDFTATIIGPSDIEAYLGCQWYVATTEGTEPFTYVWTVNGQIVGENANTLDFTNSNQAFTIIVSVFDDDGGLAWDSHAVAIDDNALCH